MNQKVLLGGQKPSIASNARLRTRKTGMLKCLRYAFELIRECVVCVTSVYDADFADAYACSSDAIM